MKILITGATGLVGAGIVAELQGQHELRVLVRNEQRARSLLPYDLEFVEGDVTDLGSLIRAAEGCERIYHAAGLPEQWFRNPSIFESVNVRGTHNLLEAAKKTGVRRVVYTSTIDVFEASDGQPYDESKIDQAPKGTHYERSKQAADRLAVQYLEDGMDIVFLHPAGVYGPGPSTSPGINDFIRDLILGKVPMLLPGGFPVVFSEDCARGHVLAADRAKAGDRFILSESYHSLLDLARLVERVHGLKKIPSVMPVWFAKGFAALGEGVASLTGKAPLLPRGQLTFLLWQARPRNDRARSTLGWDPVSVEEGVRRTIEDLKGKGLQ